MTGVAEQSAQAVNQATSAASAAKTQNQAKMRQACQMFEAMFLNLLWKEMRRTVNKSGLNNGGFGEEMFTGMMDEAVAQASADQGSMGIASMLEKQLGQASGIRPSGQIGQSAKPLAGSLDQIKAAGAAASALLALPAGNEKKETSLSKWY